MKPPEPALRDLPEGVRGPDLTDAILAVLLAASACAVTGVACWHLGHETARVEVREVRVEIPVPVPTDRVIRETWIAEEGVPRGRWRPVALVERP